MQLTLTVWVESVNSRRRSGENIQSLSKAWVPVTLWPFLSSPFVCFVYKKPEVKFMHSSIYTEHARNLTRTKHDCTWASCVCVCVCVCACANNCQGQLQTPQYQYVLVQGPYIINNARSISFYIVQGGSLLGEYFCTYQWFKLAVAGCMASRDVREGVGEGNPGKCTVILRLVSVLHLQITPSPLTAHFSKWFTSLSTHCAPPSPRRTRLNDC